MAAVPYDVVSTAEARALAAGNPLSFLHVSRAEIDLPDGDGPACRRRVRAGRRQFRPASIGGAPGRGGWAEPLRLSPPDGRPRPDRGRRLLLGRRVRARRHPQARADAQGQGGRPDPPHHRAAGPDRAGVPGLSGDGPRSTRSSNGQSPRGRCSTSRPTTASGHAIWRTDPAECLTLVEAFAGVPFMYIADGHHRAASAMRARQAASRGFSGRRFEPSPTRFLAVAFPHDQTRILPYHRLRDGPGRCHARGLRRLARDAGRAGTHGALPAPPCRTARRRRDVPRRQLVRA